MCMYGPTLYSSALITIVTYCVMGKILSIFSWSEPVLYSSHGFNAIIAVAECC